MWCDQLPRNGAHLPTKIVPRNCSVPPTVTMRYQKRPRFSFSSKLLLSDEFKHLNSLTVLSSLLKTSQTTEVSEKRTLCLFFLNTYITSHYAF